MSVHLSPPSKNACPTNTRRSWTWRSKEEVATVEGVRRRYNASVLSKASAGSRKSCMSTIGKRLWRSDCFGVGCMHLDNSLEPIIGIQCHVYLVADVVLRLVGFMQSV
jgi:hypothetical protein